MLDCEHFGEGFLSQLNIWAAEHCVPFNTTFELTPFCNFRCVMCYIRLDKNQAEKQGEMLTADQWVDIARQLRDMGTLKLTLTGGEVFTHPDFWKIYSELNQMGFWIVILSNGYLINEDTMAKFRMYGMPHAVKLTLYGASDKTYSKVCGVTDGFTRISEAIDLLKENGVPTTMTATVVRENAADLQQMYHFAAEKKIPFQHSVSVLKSSRGAENSAETSRLGVVDYSDEFTLDDFENSKFKFIKEPFSMCASYRKSLFITWNGNLQLCSFLSTPSIRLTGNISSDFNTLYKQLSKIKNPQECEACAYKVFCLRCPAILCTESGHPEKIDPKFCETAKLLSDLYKTKKGIEL